MSSSLSDILNKRNFDEPEEIVIIKKFIQEEFGQLSRVKLTENTIFITVSSAALAGALRPRLHELEEMIKTKKRLSIRIGSQ